MNRDGKYKESLIILLLWLRRVRMRFRAVRLIDAHDRVRRPTVDFVADSSVKGLPTNFVNGSFFLFSFEMIDFL